MKLFILLLLLAVNFRAEAIISQISQGLGGQASNGNSLAPTISANGRFIAFHSQANNLVAGDHNGFADIFVYDRQQHTIERVNVNDQGQAAQFVSFFPSISAEGQFIAFQSDAANLVADDDNRTTDIFVHTLATGKTELISRNNRGQIGNAASSLPRISAEGRYVVFQSQASNLVRQDHDNYLNVFLYDRQTQRIEQINVNSKGQPARGNSYDAVISATGRYVAFSSEAANLASNDQNQTSDIFLHDRTTGTTRLISMTPSGIAGNEASFETAISADGCYLAFTSRADDLVAEDHNNVADVLSYDCQTEVLSRVSVNSAGEAANGASFAPSLSADGRYIGFNSQASNLDGLSIDDNQSVDVFIHDRMMGTTERLSLASYGSGQRLTSLHPPAISADGRLVAFETSNWNLVADDFNEFSDIFVFNRAYDARFEVATGRLSIPVLMVPSIGLYRATLEQLSTSETMQFRLNKASRFRIPLTQVEASYHLDTGVLWLPAVEIFEPPHPIQRFAVEMSDELSRGLFTVKRIVQLK